MPADGVGAAFCGDEVEGQDDACVEAEDAFLCCGLSGRGTDDGFGESEEVREFERVVVPETFVADSALVVDAEGEGHEETLDLEDCDRVLPCFVCFCCPDSVATGL